MRAREFITEAVKQRLDPKCWKGKHKEGTKIKGGVRVNNCVPNESVDADQLFDIIEEMVEALAQQPRVRAIGETGLDYFRTPPELRARQQESFKWHIDLAKRTNKALVIHDRDSHDDVLSVLAEVGAPEKTVFHCFSGDVEMAKKCIERGYVLSFAGTVTFKNAPQLREALAITPIDQILVETDAPFLAPMPHRGALNSPAQIATIVRAMAAERNADVAEFATALSRNAERIFGSFAAGSTL